MSRVKYRQLVDGRWHFWGYIDNCFVSPITNQQRKPINCQFTGLHDVNGVEIYEGDVLECEFFSGSLLVFYCKELASFLFKGDSLNGGFAGFHQYSASKFKVICNIYEHPHLLNTDK